MGNFTVYRHTNNVNGKVYIGITSLPVEKRWKNGSSYKTSRYFFMAIKKYGWDGFTHEILATGLSKEEAQKIEVDLIQSYRDSNCGCYNILSGGNLGRLGISMSDETREKLRQAHSGKKLSDKHRKKLSQSHKGKTLSCETREKISTNNVRYWSGKKRDPITNEKNRKAHLGKIFSAEQRERMAESCPRELISQMKKKPVLQMDLLGNPLRIWESMKEAELAINGRLTGGISACCQGKYKTSCGYKWKILT